MQTTELLDEDSQQLAPPQLAATLATSSGSPGAQLSPSLKLCRLCFFGRFFTSDFCHSAPSVHSRPFLSHMTTCPWQQARRAAAAPPVAAKFTKQYEELAPGRCTRYA